MRYLPIILSLLYHYNPTTRAWIKYEILVNYFWPGTGHNHGVEKVLKILFLFISALYLQDYMCIDGDCPCFEWFINIKYVFDRFKTKFSSQS